MTDIRIKEIEIFRLHSKQWKRNVQLSQVIVQLAIGFGQDFISNHIQASNHFEIRNTSILASTLYIKKRREIMNESFHLLPYLAESI